MIKEKVVATIMMMIYVFSLSPLSMYAQEPRDIVREKEELLGSIREGIVEPISNSKEIKALEGGEVAVEGARIIIPVGALETDTEIKITKLQKTPEIGESIINVTNGGGGYRFEPAGTQFLRAVEIELGYDKKLNEKEGSLEDLKTYYYDVVEKQWVALETKGYDKERGVVKSISTHFTDMINGTLSLPESAGPIDVNLNSIKNLEAAHASVGVVKLEGLEGSSQGDASFNLKIELPDGRRGMKPQVTVSYSSGGGNGLVGKGFDINYGSSISVDTRKGSVNYKNTKDFVYIYDGVLLEKVKNSETAYRRLRESQHSEIKYEKNGNYWVVREKDGSKKYYGKSGNSWSGIDENKKHVWHLEKVQDIYGNTIEYSYLKEDGYVYPDRIYYTGYEGGGERSQGQYVIRFGYEERKDIRVDMRGGYKSELKNRLRTVEIAEEGGVIQRSYVFEYEEGIAKESMVKNFICYGDYGKGERGEEWWRYGFEYEKIQEKEGKPQYFSDKVVRYGDEHTPLWVNNNSSVGSQYSSGGGVGVGFGVVDVRVTGGVNWSNSDGENKVKSTLLDINGDGRVDIVRQEGGLIYYRLNNGKGFDTERIGQILEYDGTIIEKETNKNETIGGNVYLGLGTPVPFISAGAGPVWSKQTGSSELSSSFMDVDGDGLVDIAVSDRKYYYKNISESNKVEYIKTMYQNLEGVEEVKIALDAETKEEYHRAYYIQRPFRMWKAPYEGTVKVEQKVENKGNGNIIARTYRGDNTLNELSIGGKGQKTSTVVTTIEKEGQLYYIHDIKGSETARDIRGNDIEWNIKVSYTTIKPFKKITDLLEYNPPLTAQTIPDELHIIYRSVDEDDKFKEYRLLEDWKERISLESNTGELYSFLYNKGYYVPLSVKKELFEKILKQKTKEQIESLALYYVYNSSVGEYQISTYMKDQLHHMQGLLSIEEKNQIIKSFKIEGVEPKEEKGEIVYKIERTNNVSNDRLKNAQGSVYENGNYIFLGEYNTKEMYIKDKYLYMGGIQTDYTVERGIINILEGELVGEVNPSLYKILVDKKGVKGARLEWEFSDSEKKAQVISREERDKIYADSFNRSDLSNLYKNIYTQGRDIFKIENSYWNKIREGNWRIFFDRYISNGSITENQVKDFYSRCFTLETVTEYRKTADAQGEYVWDPIKKEDVWKETVPAKWEHIPIYKEYVRKNSAAEKAYANSVLKKLDESLFYSDIFPCYQYDGSIGAYRLENKYKGTSSLETILENLTKDYKLFKYKTVKMSIDYNVDYEYPIENGVYKYIGYKAGSILLEEKVSTIKVSWDSKKDFSVENDSQNKTFTSRGEAKEISEEDMQKLAAEAYSKKEALNDIENIDNKDLITAYDIIKFRSKDFLYGGMNSWYYGIWMGDETLNAFSESKLYKQIRAAEEEASLYKKMSKQESKNKLKDNKSKNDEYYDDLENEDKQDQVIQQNSESGKQTYYLVKNYQQLEKLYGDKTPEEESSQNGQMSEEIENYLFGDLSLIIKNQEASKNNYYFPYISKDRVYVNRSGGEKYYEVLETGGVREGIGVLRKSSSKGKDSGVSVSVSITTGSYSNNESSADMVQNVQDINGDGVVDIVQALPGGFFKVKYGIKGENEKGEVVVSFSEIEEIKNVGSVLSKTINEVKTTGFGAGVGTNLLSQRNSKGTLVGISLPASANISGNTSVASGSNLQTIGMMDINGDGLLDYIDGKKVKLGTGYEYIDSEVTNMFDYLLDSTVISKSNSINASLGIPQNVSKSDNTLILTVGLGVGENAGTSVSNNNQLLLDINGDGLSDIVRKKEETVLGVKFNTGIGFLEEKEIYIPEWGNSINFLNTSYWNGIEKDLPYDELKNIPLIGSLSLDMVEFKQIENIQELIKKELDFTASMTAGINGGINAGGTVIIPVLPWLSVNISANGSIGTNGSVGVSSVSLKMFDIDGDGYVDQVLRIPGYGTFAKLNLGAKVGLLKKINLPQGGRYELEYERVGNTVNMPQSKYVLSKVRSIDSLETESVGVDTYRRNYEYKDGYYDRIQKEFYGFSNVISKSVDEYNTVLSHQETAYQNRAYYTKGMEKTQRVYSISSGRLLYEKETIVDIAPYARVAAVFTTIHDEHLIGLSRKSIQRFEYENTYGNVLAYHDDGDEKNSSQRISAFIEYWNDNNNYLHNHPLKIEVRNGQGNVLRVREAVYSEKGSLQELKQYSSNTKYLSHRYEYDGYGNVTKVTDALGVKILYEYDRSHHQYLVKIGQQGRNGTLYESYIEWDEKRGLKQGEKDVNDNELSYTYDAKGRLTAIRTSYDRGRVSSVSYQYVLEKGNRWYAVSANKILYDADDESVMLTVVELDGLGRVRRTGKSGTVYSVESKNSDKGWNVSGTVSYDGKGRVVKEGQPYFVKSQEGEDGVGDFIKSNRQSLNATHKYTEKSYDSLDRVIQVVLPDASVMKTVYGLEELQNESSYRIMYEYVKTIDPLDNQSIQYKDVRNNIIQVERKDRSNKLLTKARYYYNELGEMQKAEDAKGNPVIVRYDMLGRKLSLESSDSGREEYTYDDKGLLWKVTDSELRRRQQYILYEYDEFGRIEKIDYPSSKDIVYEYGRIEDKEKKQVGKIKRIEDESGIIEYEYGRLGELVKEKRSLYQKTDGLGRKREAQMVYRSDYLGRMQSIEYPDGEVVRYEYNYGGEVEKVYGEKQGETFIYVEKIGYDEFGQRVFIRLGNGVETTYTYDENRRWLSHIETISSIQYSNPVLQNMSYEFDLVGNVKGYSNNAGSYTTSQQYEYDGLYQLVGVKGQTENREVGLVDYKARYEQRYEFDESGLGNMIKKTSESHQSTTRQLGDNLNYSLDYEYEKDFAHRARKIGNRYYKYDSNGNVLVEQESEFSKEEGSVPYNVEVLENDVHVADYGWGIKEEKVGSGSEKYVYKRSYEWNERKLLKSSNDNRYKVEYVYGSDGQRSGKRSISSGGSDSESLYFNKMWVWRYDGLLSDRSGRNSKHIYVGESRIVTKISRADGSFTSEEKVKQYYYHTDHLGSAQLISDPYGKEYERVEYTPYGELWVEKASAASNIDIPYRFTGKERDEETGLYYYGARYLDSKTSRWLSTDPALGEYVPGAPINDEAKKRNSELPGMGGVFNTVNLHLYHYAGNNPMKYVDPDGRASILTRPINGGVSKTYDAANFIGKKTGIRATLHSLVDMGDLSSVSKVHQYSGSSSGFTKSDTYSKEKEYTIVYSGMDDALTDEAVENVLSLDQFGANDNESAKGKYKIFSNDCNTFTNAVFKEYEKLWKEDFKTKNEGASDRDIKKAWNEHKTDITKDAGKKIEINQ